MKDRLFTTLFILCATQLPAQIPASTSETSASAPGRVAQTHTSDIGFSYGLPLDWEVVDSKPLLPEVEQQAGKEYGSDAEKMAACIQLPLTAHHGTRPPP
ncbi:MAG: hypothetical protein ACLPND_09380 [Candidatus Korobacteraceae bacterium]